MGAIRILNTLFSLQDENLIKFCLDASTETSPPFEYINDPKVIGYLFKKIFKVDDLSDDLDEALKGIRKPSALIHYHSRLMELKGKDQEDAINAFQTFLKAALAGNLTDVRHDTENNPHLQHIFSKLPTLKETWIQHEESKVKDILPGIDSKIADWSVMETEDCSDLILQSSEFYATCISLNGRLPKIHGLLGIFLDGKTHTILVKDQNGNPRAKTRIVLLWDEKNEKPVLFVDQFHFQTGKDNLVDVMKEFVKAKAKKTGLDMVTTFGDGGSRYSGFGPKYDGNIVSLGSNSPVEYLNTFMCTCKETYTIDPVYIFDQAS